jgi:isocitrate dehydrogenase
MKFVITESKREELIDKFLSKEYGGLIRYDSNNRPDLIFFVRDTKKEPIKRDIVFFYNKEDQYAFINWKMVTHIQMFTGDEFESERFIKRWLKKTYGIDPVKLYNNF